MENEVIQKAVPSISKHISTSTYNKMKEVMEIQAPPSLPYPTPEELDSLNKDRVVSQVVSASLESHLSTLFKATHEAQCKRLKTVHLNISDTRVKELLAKKSLLEAEISKLNEIDLEKELRNKRRAFLRQMME